MATTKKPTSTKKTTKASPAAARKKPTTSSAARTAAAKKPVVATRKPAARRPAPKRTVAATNQPAPFMSVQPTAETVYWLLFGAAILGLGVWVLNLTVKINDIYDQIDMNNNASTTLQTLQTKPAVKP